MPFRLGRFGKPSDIEKALWSGFLLAPIAAAGFGWLDGREFLVQIAVLPGGFMIGGITYLLNGCVEYYADVLPPKYRQRSSQETEWRAMFADDDMVVVRAALEQTPVCEWAVFNRNRCLPTRPAGDLLGLSFGPISPHTDASSELGIPSRVDVTVPLRTLVRLPVRPRSGVRSSGDALARVRRLPVKST